jgi:Leucine-rich repeat (LRR) protein
MKLFSLILFPISTLAVYCEWEADKNLLGEEYKVTCDEIAVAGDLDSIDWNAYNTATELKLKMMDGHDQFDDDTEITSIVSALKKFPNLEKITLHGFDGLLSNRITKANLNVNELQVKKTLLSSFPANLFKDSNIETFHVKDSELETIDHLTFKNQNSLKKLRIENSKIDTVSDIAFKYLEELEHLDMSQNDINSVSTKVFKMLPNLQKLDLANNRLSSLPADIFKFNTELRAINLNNNDFAELPCDLFKFQQKLTSLNVTNNRLTHLQCHCLVARNLIVMDAASEVRHVVDRIQNMWQNATFIFT